MSHGVRVPEHHCIIDISMCQEGPTLSRRLLHCSSLLMSTSSLPAGRRSSLELAPATAGETFRARTRRVPGRLHVVLALQWQHQCMSCSCRRLLLQLQLQLQLASWRWELHARAW